MSELDLNASARCARRAKEWADSVELWLGGTSRLICILADDVLALIERVRELEDDTSLSPKHPPQEAQPDCKIAEMYPK